MKRLAKYAKSGHRTFIALTIVEAIVVASIGVVASNLRSPGGDWDAGFVWFITFLSALYLFLLIITTAYTVNFPGSIKDELQSERKLDQLQKDAKRQQIVSGFLVETMQRLNGQTCALTPNGNEHLCDQDISLGIGDLLDRVINNIGYLLDTPTTEYSIGVYLDHYETIDDKEQGKGVIRLHDSLNKSGLFTKRLLELPNLQGELLKVKHAILESFNNFEFHTLDYEAEDNKEYTLICSPIPVACDENDCLGVFFIVGQKLDPIPNDLPTNLTIFNRVIANWVYRYNDCALSRKEKIKDQQG